MTERSTGNLLAGVGYSSADGLVFNASVSQQNIFGSGNALIAALNTSEVNRTISLAFTEPYWTVDGVSRTLEVYDKFLDPTSLSVSRYETRTIGAAASFGIPDHGDRHRQRRAPVRAHRHHAVRRQPAGLQRVRRAVRQRRPTRSSSRRAGPATRATTSSIRRAAGCRARCSRSGCRSATSLSTRRSTCSSGSRRCSVDSVLMLRGDLGYADGYSGKPLPFFKAFFAGGVGSVRGYEQSSLGPAGHLRQRDRRQAQDRRQRRAVLPDPQGRQVGAGQRLRRRRPDLRRQRIKQSTAAVPRDRPAGLPLLGRRSASRGTRRSGRSSSATRFRSTTSRATGSSAFQFQVGSVF